MQTTLLLDSDQIAYTLALRCDSISDARKSSAQLIESYKFKFSTDDYMTFMSCHRTQGFRRAIMPEYKANRDERPSPPLLDGIRRMLFDEHCCIKEEKIEADDGMSIAMTRKSSVKNIGISYDGDMRTVAGWTFNPKKEEFEVYTDEETAYKNYLKKVMTGDSSDNFKGIPKVGPKTADKLFASGQIKNLFDVASLYREKGLSDDYFLATARCARLIEDGEYDFDTRKIIYRRDKILLNNLIS